MKRFRNIVISKTEPRREDLWFRPVLNSLDPTKSGGFGLWWYSPSGWKALIDSDTKYDVSSTISTLASSNPVSSSSSTNSANGIVTATFTYYVYDGSRDLGEYSNIVLESGLKVQVEALTALIEAEAEDRASADSTLQSQINSNASAISELQEAISGLDSSSSLSWISI